MQIGIAGAGIVGCLCAYLFSRQGHQVTVFEASANGVQATLPPRMLLMNHPSTMTFTMPAQEPMTIPVQALQAWAQIVADLAATEAYHSTISEFDPHQGAIQTVPAALLSPALLLSTLAQQAHGVLWHWCRRVTRLSPHTIHIEQDKYSFDWVLDARGRGAFDIPCYQADLLSCRHVPVAYGLRYLFQTVADTAISTRRWLRQGDQIDLIPLAGGHCVVDVQPLSPQRAPTPRSLQTMTALWQDLQAQCPTLATASVLQTEVTTYAMMVNALPRLEIQTGLTRINGVYPLGWSIVPALVQQILPLQLAPTMGAG